MENIEKNEFIQNIIRILKGCIVAVILTLVFLFIFAILLTYTNIQENIITPAIIVITAISILVGSSISTLRIKKMGLLNGGLVGLIYIFAIYLLSSITGSGFSLEMSSIIMIVASIISGMVGRYNRS